MSGLVDQLMAKGKAYGAAATLYEHIGTEKNCAAMEAAEQEFRAALLSALMPLQVSATGVLVSQVLTMAVMMEKALEVLKNVEAEGGHDQEDLQELINRHEEAIATVLKHRGAEVPQHG